MITSEQFDNNSISAFMIEHRNEIPLIDTVKIDNLLYGRFDIIMNRYYKGRMDFIQLVMDFNKISDPIEIKIGAIIELPDLFALEDLTSVNNILDTDIIPGVNETPNSRTVNNSMAGNNKSLQTTAVPKLKIKKEPVSYDSETGVLKL